MLMQRTRSALPAAAAPAGPLALVAEPREVARVTRRLHLDRADPVVPAHAVILRSAQARDEEAARPVHVREREQELRPPRVREAGPLLAERLDLEAGRF